MAACGQMSSNQPRARGPKTELVAWAEQLGAEIAPYAAEHDRDGTFVTEAFELLKSSGYLAIAVPEELGGRGATIREVAMAQRALARHCGSTALASAMHMHVTPVHGVALPARAARAPRGR